MRASGAFESGLSASAAAALIRAGLRAYESARKDRVAAVRFRSDIAGRAFEAESALGVWRRYALLKVFFPWLLFRAAATFEVGDLGG